MVDREKVITGLECCSVKQSCSECPWMGLDCNDRLHLAALELLKEQPQWISVKKKLPEQAGYRCLVSAEYGDRKRAYFIAFTGYGKSEWYTYDALFMENEKEADNRVHHNYHITHWMQMPEPPEVM